jgi:hypothetical protein
MITAQIARFILKEHKHRPITGDLLCIGRQTIAMTVVEAMSLLIEEGITPRGGIEVELDEITVAGKEAKKGGMEYISDKSFFLLFCDAKLSTLDSSSYEAANIMWDLNYPRDGEYKSCFDFVFNGSCLDNLFDPAQAMINMSSFLGPLGRLLSFEHGTLTQSAYLAYSPEWFWGFFEANLYEDINLWLTWPCQVDRNQGSAGPSLQGDWRVGKWHPSLSTDGLGHFMTVVLAEKGEASTNDQIPSQEHYKALWGEGGRKMTEGKRRFEFPNSVSTALVPWR